MAPRSGLVFRIGSVAVILAVTITGGGCVFRAPPSAEPGNAALVVQEVPVLLFNEDDCGAGSLATLLTFWGVAFKHDRLATELPRMRRGKVLSIDLLLAAREYGLDAHWTVGNEQVLSTELRERRPVILLLRVANAPGRKRDHYHYVVVDGFDPESRLVRVLFGDGEVRWIGLDRLEKAWRGGGYALLRARRPPSLGRR